MTGIRVIVTGSRSWTDREFLHGVLDSLAFNAAAQGFEEFTVVHGDCPQGGDAIARQWADTSGPFAVEGNVLHVREDRHPAKWAKHGRGAGFIRNREMVDLGADFCAAFILPCADPKCRRKKPHGTHGASRCADYADGAGIPTQRWPERWEQP